MKIISWNVNSLRAREPIIEKIIKTEAPDIFCLQELKILDKEYVENFFNQFSLKTVAETQKSYNGVSISCKREIVLSEKPLKKLNMTQARNNTVIIKDKNLAILNCYFPNGNPIDTDKFTNKLEWMKLLYKEIEILKKEYEVLLMGDFNVIPDDEDAHDIKKYKNDALAQPESRKEFYKLINLDLIDVFKTTPKKQSYTFFDYKTYKFGKEEGIRIDFFLLSPFLKSKIMKLKVLKEYRDMDRPSDHCPILIDLNI